MARRLKLKDVHREVETEGQQHVSLRNNPADSQLQNLFVHPKAKRLFVLDKEMNELVRESGLTIDEKVRQFEEKLSEFIKLKDLLIRHGSLLDMNNFGKSLEEKIEEKVEEAIKKMLSPTPQPVSDTLDTTKTSTAITTIVPAQQVPNKSDTTNAMEIPAGTLSSFRHTDIQPIERVYETLSRHGIRPSKDNKSKVEVSVPQSSVKQTYLKKTLDDVVKHFLETSPSERDTSRTQWKNLMSYVYDAMKNESDFGDMLNKYPNLNRYHLRTSFPVQNWESMK